MPSEPGSAEWAEPGLPWDCIHDESTSDLGQWEGQGAGLEHEAEMMEPLPKQSRFQHKQA